MELKIAFLIIVAGVSNVLANPGYSQVAKVSLAMGNKSLEQVMDEIERQSEFYFIFNQKQIDVNRVVDIQAENKLITDILLELFKGTNVNYAVFDRKILLTTDPLENDLLAIASATEPQQKQITGTVTDKDGTPLPGVNVVVTGTTQGTITDIAGKYSIEVPQGARSLTFSFIGMQSQEITIGTLTQINVTMAESAVGLEEVIVIGYGTQKKVNITGAVDVAGRDKLENRGFANTAAALQGISGNLNIKASNLGGEPGANVLVNIRGIGTLTGNRGQPYVLVDGMPIDMNDIDPEHIENISILKDAAASAIYGARAPYGVILITTKKGVKNSSTIKYSSSIVWKHPTIIPHNMSSVDYANKSNLAADNSGKGRIFNEEYLNRIQDYYDGKITDECVPSIKRPGYWAVQGNDGGNANNDWPYMHWDNWAPQQKQNLSFSGGGENATYYVGAGYFHEKGVMTWGDEYYKKYDIVANLNAPLQKWFTLDLKINYINDYQQNPVSPKDWSRDLQWWYTFDAPTRHLYTPEGKIVMVQVLELMAGAGNDKTYSNSLWFKLGGELEPIKGFKTNISYSRNFMAKRNTILKKTTYWPLKIGGPDEVIRYPVPSFSVENSIENHYLFNITSSYQKSVGDHNFQTMVGFENEFLENCGLYGKRQGLITDVVPSIILATGASDLYDWWTNWSTMGVFMRINYNFQEKYLFELNGRYDGSSRFQEAKNKWGFFPSVSVGYNISKEPFWEVLSFIDLKIRGSYGSLGNQNVPNYSYLPIVPIKIKSFWIIGNERPNYASVPSLTSSSLSWEIANNFNIGMDAAFFKSKLTVVFDWFKRNTTNMFGPAEALPSVLGAAPSLRNNAELSTVGFETRISWRDKIGKDLNYGIEFTLGDNRSKVVKYNNPSKYLGTWYEGQTIGEIWGYETEGFFEDKTDVESHADQTKLYLKWSAGDIKFKDLDDDGEIWRGKYTLEDHGDLKIIGNSEPRYLFGVIGTMNYKGFDFRILLQGVAKRDLSLTIDEFWGSPGSGTINLQQHTDFWTPEGSDIGGGPNAYYPKVYYDSEVTKNRQVQTKYLQDASYLRVKDIQLGYTIPQDLTKIIKIQNARIYVIGNNILTFTNLIKIFDPDQETNFAGGRYTYQLTKFYGCGLNITF